MEWCADEDFWAGTAGVLFGDARWLSAPQEVDAVLALMPLPAGARLLDVPCGPGRHALELARRGHHVTGVDRTAVYLDEARRKAQQDGLDVEWVQADMRAFCRSETFDAALNLFTSFGYFEDPRDDRQVAENLYASLKPGGQLLMDLMSKEILARMFRPRDWHEEPDGTMMIEERTLDRDWGWVNVRWLLVKDGRIREHRFGHRLYSAVELKTLLEDVGFVDLQVYGSLEGTPYDHEAKRLVIAARRP